MWRLLRSPRLPSFGRVIVLTGGPCRQAHLAHKPRARHITKLQSWTPNCRAGTRLDRQHDLSEMLVGAHVRLRGDRLVEREGTVDRKRKLAGRDRAPQIGP